MIFPFWARRKNKAVLKINMKRILSLLAAGWRTLCGGEAVNGQESERFKETKIEAEQGDAEAQNLLGWMYEYGRGVAEDKVEAAKWFRKAAKQGYARAQHWLGLTYYKGDGVPRDYEEAVKWFRKAAEQGEGCSISTRQSQHWLGQMYYKGDGVPRDYEEAAKWYRKLAEQGDAVAQYNLGQMYYFGDGMPKNFIEAYAWSLLANVKGLKGSRKMISHLEKRLTAEQMEKGQARAAELHRLIKERKENPKLSVESP